MKYTSSASAKLTLVISYMFCALLLFLMIFAKPILHWLFGDNRIVNTMTVMISFYVCCVPAWAALGSIIKLLKNIIKEKIFILQNVFCLRLLSWCCAVVALVCAAAGFYYVPMWIFALGAAFMMLILRVLKSVMAKATEIKAENELTI